MPDQPWPVARCGGPKCGREVIWAMDDKKLNRVAVDPDPSPVGKVKLMWRLDSHNRPRVVAHVCTPTEMITTSWGAPLHQLHSATCPEARRTHVRSRTS